jgi:hypothetical protein
LQHFAIGKLKAAEMEIIWGKKKIWYLHKSKKGIREQSEKNLPRQFMFIHCGFLFNTISYYYFFATMVFELHEYKKE